ncbi:hypothetical protein [Nevskia soli]|uniref:Nmad2 family putative nucleotide modification protein n=1 Tax=Nevskia soli TaxID=418856 RepID=UPI000A038967|nr:hypothetical protein [Nevskia soli]
MSRLYSYVVRYDSGFAPNPFYGFCTLATCKPPIRKGAEIGDWIVGTGSGDRTVRRAGYLVYAMRVASILSFQEYDANPNFEDKKPYRRGSRKQSCGDNIYYWDAAENDWGQRDSFHTNNDGSIHAEHVRIDTGVNRVLIGDDFVYFGGEGPLIPDTLTRPDGRTIIHSGIGYSCIDDARSRDRFIEWIRSLRIRGFQGSPFEWISLRAKSNPRHL